MIRALLGSGVAGPVLRCGWRSPVSRCAAPRTPVVLLYHGVPAASSAGVSAPEFERHIRFIVRHYDTAFPDDYRRRRASHERVRVILTFDDGYRNNAEVVAPILRRYRVPALFFICSRHAVAGKYLWFSYLRALEDLFRWPGLSCGGDWVDMREGQRRRSVKRLTRMLLGLRPHPSAMYDAIERELPPLEEFATPTQLADGYAGMTAEQVGELAADPLFSVGVHTVDHPYLTRCEPDEAVRQIQDNRAWIERACASACTSIAYPSGDYDANIVAACRSAGFVRGYAVTSSRPHVDLELPRLGVYAASTDVLGFKLQWGPMMRDLRIPVG
jgi:peptidoglycan/xylan/chitin deacetylase (PgdA/CDA1 family)